MQTVPLIRLNNGYKCPQLGLGTWLSRENEAIDAVSYAISVGYRHFDCAFVYGNEGEIGRGIRAHLADGTVKRDELFIVTKLWNTFHRYEDVKPACQKSLSNFQLDYLDLYLMHWPVAQNSTTALDYANPFANAMALDYDYLLTWSAMEECVDVGLTRSIGVSNFNRDQLERLLANCRHRPVMNQVEFSRETLFNQKPLIQFCQQNDIQVTAYSPFASPGRTWRQPADPHLDLGDSRLVVIAKKHFKTVPQVVLRYLLQSNTIPIPKSSSQERIKENFMIFDFELDSKEMAIIDTMHRSDGRVVPAAELKGFPHYPF